MDKLTRLRAFCITAETKRFRSAAERLNVSPAMASKYVTLLEKEIGIRLLNRNSRHVALTDEGRDYFDQAKRIIEQIDQLDKEFTDKSNEISGIIKLTAPVWMACNRFSEIIAGFCSLHKDVSFEIDLSARAANLIEDGFDIALRVNQNMAPGLIARKVSLVNFGLYAMKDYIDNGAPLENLRDISNHRILAYSGINNVEKALEMVSGEKLDGNLKIAIRSESEVLLKEMALQRLGIAILPHWLIDKKDIEIGFRRYLAETINFDAPLFAVYSSKRLLPNRIRAFINYLAGQKL